MHLPQGGSDTCVGCASQPACEGGASRLIGAASQASKLERVEASGATHVLDYDRCTKEQLLQLTSGSGVDLVLDAVGGAVRDVGLSAMAPFGRAVLYGTSSGEQAGLTGEQLMDVLMGNKSIIGFGLLDHAERHPEFVGEAWDGLTSALAEGRLDVVHRAFPLEEVRAAQAAMERRETVGKIVLVP
jgi:NADPH2:quinone reductase